MKRMRASTFLPVSAAVVFLAATNQLKYGLSVTAFSPMAPMASTSHATTHHTHSQWYYQQNRPTIAMSSTTDPNSDGEESLKNSNKNPTLALVSAMQNMFAGSDDKSSDNDNNKLITNPNPKNKIGMQLAAAVMAFSLAFLPLNNADAAMSGGRMGGSFSASPRSSMSRPAPSRSSYGGGGGGYSSRTTIITPGIGGGYGYGYGYSPFMSPFSPFTPRIYGSPGVITYSRGPSFFDLLLFGGFTFAVVLPFLSSLTSSSSSSSSSVLDWDSSRTASSALGPGTSVCQVSVALEVPNRDDRNSILSVLDRLAQTAKTDSRVGIQNLSSQVALELLRRRSSIVSASSSYKHFNDRNKALREFQSRSVKERSKFESETVSQFGGVNYGVGSNILGSGDADGKATMAVVTLILAIDGDSTKLPRINSVEDLEKALRKISTDAKVDDCLQSAEILWTPTDRSESLSPRDVVADYPEMRSI